MVVDLLINFGLLFASSRQPSVACVFHHSWQALCARQGLSDCPVTPSLSSLATSAFANCASSALNFPERVAMDLTSGDKNWNKG